VAQLGQATALPMRNALTGAIRSNRIVSARCWVCWGNWMPYRAVNPALFASIEGSNPSTPTIVWTSRSLTARMTGAPTAAAPNLRP
jgi:hypothetical protein